MTAMFCSRHQVGWDSPPCPALCPACQDAKSSGGRVAHHDYTEQERLDDAGDRADTPRVNYAGSCGTSALRVEAAKLERELAEAKRSLSDVTRERDSIERRLSAMLPLFEEARDALSSITLVHAKLHGLRLDLGDRMDAVGDPARWAASDATEAPK